MVTVNLKSITSTGNTALVEYSERGKLYRKYIPASEIKDEQVSVEVLETGTDYGLPWEEIITLSGTPETMAKYLRANGIWTLDDLTKHPNIAIGALQTVYQLDLAALITAARSYLDKGV